MTLSEVHSSSVNSTCVDVSRPFLNKPDTIDSGNEQSQSPNPDTQKIFELDDSPDESEVDPELNMMQILHAESPQQSFLLSAPDRCDLHRAPSCLPDVDDGDANSQEGSCDERNTFREDDVDQWQMSEEDEASDITDFGVINEEKQATSVQPSNEPSVTESCAQCEVYTMTFGGMYAYTATPSPEIDDDDKQVDLEKEDKVDLKPSDQDVDVQLASKTSGTPYEIYTMNFGGLYTFTTTTTSAISNSVTELLEEQPNLTGENLLEREENSSVESTEPEDKTDKPAEPTTPYEVYTVSFGGLHTFTATPSSVSDGDINNSESSSAMTEADTSQKPTESQEQREVLKVDKADCNLAIDNHAICTPYEVHTVTFGGLYTFTATLPPIQCDGAPPLHAVA